MSIDFKLDDEGIALITMNRPEKLNALDADHYRMLSEAWERVRDDPAVRVAPSSPALAKNPSAPAPTSRPGSVAMWNCPSCG
jgi:E-phenylitaconyl-CoA hydratase